MWTVKLGRACLLFLSLLSLAPVAAEASPSRYFLVSVADLRASDDGDEWARESCRQIYGILNEFSRVSADIACYQVGRGKSPEADFLKKSGAELDYRIDLTRRRDNTYTLEIRNFNRKDSTDFEKVGWTLRDGATAGWKDGLLRALGNFALFIDNEEYYRLALLVNGVQESSSLSFNPDTGIFKDKLTGMELSQREAYAQFAAESDRKKNYLRSGIEIGALLAGGMAIYYKNLVYNSVDFDYGLGEGIRKKLNGDAVRFDDNDKFANAGHALAGVLYYQIARSNGFNSLESYLVALGSSTIWEFLEYHEVLSINDEIITSIGGYVVGEATHQVACALRQKNPGLFGKTVAALLDPSGAANGTMDKYGKSKNFNKLNDCARPRWSEITMYLGVDKTTKPFDAAAASRTGFGFSGDVVNVPGFDQEGKSTGIVTDTALSRFLLEGAAGSGGIDDLRVIAKVVSVAWQKRSMAKNDAGELEGYDFIIGLGHGITWNDRGTDGKDDFYGTVNVAGPTAVVNVRRNGIRIRAELGLYADFVMVKSYAVDKYAADNGTEGLQSILKKRNAYWGYGASLMGGLSAEYGRWEIGWNMQESQANIIQGKDRMEEAVTKRESFQDSYGSQSLWVGYRITRSLKVKVSVEQIRRAGRVGGAYEAHGTETRKMGYLIYEF